MSYYWMEVLGGVKGLLTCLAVIGSAGAVMFPTICWGEMLYTKTERIKFTLITSAVALLLILAALLTPSTKTLLIMYGVEYAQSIQGVEKVAPKAVATLNKLMDQYLEE